MLFKELPMIESKFMTTREAAAYVGEGVSPRTIVDWIKRGKLKAVRNPSKRGHFRVTEEALLEAMRLD
jgi:excisionase family DNA binding protein